jgi:indole-3-glycerol phosphate synthase
VAAIDDLLGRITAATRARLAERRARRSTAELTARAAARPPPRSPRFHEGGGPAVWAEIKPASPVRGPLRESLDVAAQAAAYQAGGAAAVSVLTEEDFFRGALENLAAARRGAPDLPLLRKDFLLEEEEILEARAEGADGVLLIARLLDDAALARLLDACRRQGLFALAEAYTEREVDRAVGAGAGIIGVNSRDLATFAVDRRKLDACRARIPRGVFAVAESGIGSAADLAAVGRAGYHAALVGEALMRAPDPRALLEEWRRACPAG